MWPIIKLLGFDVRYAFSGLICSYPSKDFSWYLVLSFGEMSMFSLSSLSSSLITCGIVSLKESPALSWTFLIHDTWNNIFLCDLFCYMYSTELALGVYRNESRDCIHRTTHSSAGWHVGGHVDWLREGGVGFEDSLTAFVHVISHFIVEGVFMWSQHSVTGFPIHGMGWLVASVEVSRTRSAIFGIMAVTLCAAMWLAVVPGRSIA